MKDLIIETLKTNKLFCRLSGDELSKASTLFRKQKVAEDEYVFMEGENSDRFYMAAIGQVKIVKHTPEGKDVILEIIRPPEIFGGIAVLDGRPYPASAQAMEDVTVLWTEKTTFFELIDRFHVLAIEANVYFGERLRNAYDMLRSVSVERVERRVASLLIRFGDRVGRSNSGDEIVMEMGLTMQEIAEMVGTTVETAIRVMNKLKKEKLISYGKGQTILYPALRKKFS